MKYSINYNDKIKKSLNSVIFTEVMNISSRSSVKQSFDCNLQKTKDIKFGDYSTNILMKLDISRELIPRVSKNIIKKLPKKIFKKAEVVGPGFLNLWIQPAYKLKVINEILKHKVEYGQFKNKNIFYNLEFVSANPTGLLHIGHARNAAIGDTISRIWNKYGIKVNKEYYINNAGNQIDKLALSTLIRYKQLFGKNIDLPEDSYHGQEIVDVAKMIKNKYGDKYVKVKFNEQKIIEHSTNNFFRKYASNYMLELIKLTLHDFGVDMDIWFHETELYAKGLVKFALDSLKNHTYKKDDALWLKTTELGDDKDRVLIKSDGSYTYFTPDIAYHKIKLSRGYDKIFNIWGADHKSYADRMRIAVQLLGFQPEQIQVLIMQMVRLVKDGKEYKMSKRTGNSLTLADLVEAIGKDAARWYLASQSLSSHLEIDVEKAKAKDSNNPIYYVQYAHARICKLLKTNKCKQPKTFSLLKEPIEQQIVDWLNCYIPTIESAANSCDTTKITSYLITLAKLFHSYYGNIKIINPKSQKLTTQRIWLCAAIKFVIASGLKLFDISAATSM